MSVEWFRRATVYAIRHNPTGKIYVGRTERLNTRVHQHMTQLIKGTHPIERMQQDFDQYGNDYSLFILYDSKQSGNMTCECKTIESLFMTILDTRNPDKGYNYKDNSNDFYLDKTKGIKIEYRSDAFLDPRYKKYRSPNRHERAVFIEEECDVKA